MGLLDYIQGCLNMQILKEKVKAFDYTFTNNLTLKIDIRYGFRFNAR